jgi:drug/metabolite transporter (DMT)-like permease
MTLAIVPLRAKRASPGHGTAAFLVLLLGGVCIGFAPVLVRVADVGPVASAFWRMGIAAPLMWILAWSRQRAPDATQVVSAASTGTHWHWAVLLSGVFFAADLGVWHFSIGRTTVANATLLANCAPLFVTLYGLLVYRQRPAPLFLVGLLLAMAGAVTLVGPNFRLGGGHLRGDALAVLAAVFYTGYMLAIKRARDDFGTLRLMAWSTSISAAVLLPIALLLANALAQDFWPTTMHGWWVVVALALVTQVAGQTCIAYALAHLPVALSTTGLLIQPVTAAAAAWLIFGERLGAMQLVGAMVLLLGIYLAKRSNA